MKPKKKALAAVVRIWSQCWPKDNDSEDMKEAHRKMGEALEEAGLVKWGNLSPAGVILVAQLDMAESGAS